MSDDIFVVKPAVMKGVPPLIGLWGGSWTGKTYTALLIARGLVGPKGKIGLIDTENRRAELHAHVAGGWYHLDLQPPFTPGRYIAAFAALEKAGVDCAIVDSTSHVWEGEGGVIDMADNGRTSGGYELTGLGKWKTPKMEYKRFVNTVLRAPFPVIFCLRAKDASKQTGKGKDAKIESVGLQPICGKGFIHEMTVSALLGPDHCPVFRGDDELIHCDPLIPTIKAPEQIQNIFQQGKPLGIETGQAIAAMINGAASYDIDTAQLEREARNVALMGADKLKDYWVKLGGARQRALLAIKAELTQIAEESDREASQDGDNHDEERTEGLPL